MAIANEALKISPEETSKLNLVMSHSSVKGMVEQLGKQGLELDMKQVLEGVGLAAEKKDLGIANEDVQSIMQALQAKVQKEMREKMAAKMKVEGDANKAAGEAFLAKNAEVEGVMKLDNGVQYTVMKEGSGDKPAATDKVKLHYHGTKVDGTVFDSSVDKGKPITHSASGFVKGFNAAIQAMTVGSKWKVVIPSDLAYGMRGPGSIGPNSTLIFEIELLEIVK
jgi:FKBP-type peptidyl-prolyl cis-trans isomerase